MLTLLIGGARSGKSSLAVEAGRRSDRPVTVIATAEPFDDDLATRIERHRAERPPWPTVEAPVALADAVRGVPDGSFVIVDCMTVWVGNLFHHQPVASLRADAYDAVLEALATRRHALDLVVVTNEVGLGLHPDTALGRQYRDELGWLNQRLAETADRSLLLVAGRALPLVDPWEV